MSKPKSPIHHFQCDLSVAKVDAVNGIIYGVSVITSGVQARGHELWTDDTTLDQMLECGSEMGQVPVKWNHKTGADAVNGFLTNFRKIGEKLLGDWHLLKTHSQFQQALELAERMPKNVGLSAAFRGKDERKGKKKLARCEELLAVDLVAHPAANPDGLFDDPSVDTPEPGMAEPTQKTKEPTLAEVMEVLKGVQATQQTIIDRQNEFEKFQKELIDGLNDPDGGSEEEPSPDDEPAPEPAAAGGKDGASAELSALQREVKFLTARFQQQDQDEEDHQLAEVLGSIEAKFEQLAAHNQALQHQLEARGEKPGTVLSPSTETPVTPRKAKQSEFDAKVDELVAGGKKRTVAFRLAMAEHPDLYEKHLNARGVVKTLEATE